MKVSVNWLKRYVDIPETPDDLAHDLTMFGANVEEIVDLSPSMEGVVYGKVLTVERHPRADRLSLCTVDTGGDEPLRIICGASNVRPGLGVPVALHGAVLAGGFKIKKTKIRGEVSEGMICSEIEIGIGSDADGIIELGFEAEPGSSLEGKLGVQDVVLDIEVTPNRPDMLSHLGIAREIAALYRRELHAPDTISLERGGKFKIEIEDFEDCPRYSAAFVEDVTIAPSPDWMQQLLAAAGAKPINNIVDITNFVLLEMGQPLHAFDRDRLERGTIIVRRGRKGEELVTLDETERKMGEEILVIADTEKPVAIAGVMGGLDSEVTQSTKRLLIESAMFDPRAVRMSRQSLKLETEASYRFEREGDIGITIRALERACNLIEELGAGRCERFYAEQLSDERAVQEKEVSLRAKQANRVMGTNLSAGEIASLLERLELTTRVSGKTIQVTVPTLRRDLKEEIDLIEEAARVYGYENIGREEESRCSIFAEVSYEDRRNEFISGYLSARGFAEVVTTSFMDTVDIERFGWGAGDARGNPVRLENPLTAAQSVMRTSLLPGMLNVIRRNTPAEQEGIKLFEMGKVFMPAGQGLPDEQLHLVAVFTRQTHPLHWIEEQRQMDYFDMKGELELLIEIMGIRADISVKGSKGGSVFSWLSRNRHLAEGGMIKRSICEQYDIDTPVFYFDIHLDAWPDAVPGGPAFTSIVPYPAVKRDLCVIAADRVTFADIRNIMKEQAKHLESIRLFDYYRGGHLGEGTRSYTVRLSFRSPSATLDDSTVEKEIERILSTLQRELQVVLRKK